MALDLMRARCPALEAAVEEDDGEVELTLGLSVGGSSRRAPRAGAAPQGRSTEARAGEAAADLGGYGSSQSSSPRPPPFLHADGGDALDQTRRREIHALRRREARRKRDEKQKQQKRGICRAAPAAAAPASCGASPPVERTWSASSDDRLAMEGQEHQVRIRDREARVEAAMDRVPNHKLGDNPNPNPDADADSNPSFYPDSSNPNIVPFGAQPFPMIATQYAYPHLRYVPITNGFRIPCVIPCWAPAVSPAAEGPRAERNVFQPVACRAFHPFSPPDVEPANEAVESNDGKGAPSWTTSQGSSISPATSGQQGSSPKGGSSSSSSDRRSLPTHTQGKHHPQASLQQGNSLPPGQSDSTTSPRQIESNLNAAGGRPPSERRPSAPVEKPVSAAGDTGPPRQASPPRLPRMPCVSVTGNGPNGQTITGFLYRYTKTEVSIVCACHGSSFSPAEFVQHAGGTDVTNPLRQITIVSG